MTGEPRGPHIEIDWTRCAGHGLCAEVLPDLIRMDDWGFPIVSPAPLGGDELVDARRAAALCPALALRLQAG